ncbi:hypothetical protein HYH02_013512 [Chlamydomonas schloesseri]|uniref:Activator of Hsp90 ATPase AHSA1-like N-terminal domain-containing protein n=1 Tax=Chlamydomonas schloesseri TaxID=2026947 RepID=A0A835VZ48_9CHLO|nr:hypothetical protein HYH02_013512 [Chlamydomonas schloesseri]|eukprot:KAG2430979.1 hypothetical protein HYH02_013512 [Chlamydomonas schloesseri]
MAAWGQGDPRWLVEHRDDGKNVNGWHWEEKDRKEWTKARLAELFSGQVLFSAPDADEGQPAELRVERLKEVTGDAAITTRKGNKRFAVFDLTISLAWEGRLAGEAGATARGEIRIEEVHSTSDEDDYVYGATADGSGAAQDKLKWLAAGPAVKAAVFATIAQVVAELKEQA